MGLADLGEKSRAGSAASPRGAWQGSVHMRQRHGPGPPPSLPFADRDGQKANRKRIISGISKFLPLRNKGNAIDSSPATGRRLCGVLHVTLPYFTALNL